MALQFTTSYVEDSIELFRYYKQLAERAIVQVTDGQLYATLDGEANSIAVVIKHLTGNMLSRWPDFLTTDGEKAGRGRIYRSARDTRGADETVGVRLELRVRSSRAADGRRPQP